MRPWTRASVSRMPKEAGDHTFMPNPVYMANPSPNVQNAINPGNP